MRTWLRTKRCIAGAIAVVVTLSVSSLPTPGEASAKRSKKTTKTTKGAKKRRALPRVTTALDSASLYGSTPCAPVGGTAEPVRSFGSPFKNCIDVSKTYTATMSTNLGVLTFLLADDTAPATVNNFVNLVRSKYYNGIYFHRVVENFVIQSGDPTATSVAAITTAGSGGPGYSFGDELPAPGEYKLGDLVMANAGPNTNGSQYFVISGSNGVRLSPNYSLFGRLTSDPANYVTLKAIAALAVPGGDGPPSRPVLTTSITITESGL
jgi:cyclophilin family peptidyl-prolyl cis-trans isomerase